MDGRVFLVNVGTNASHPAKSPLFPGGTFELIPIPEALGMDGARAVRFTRELAQAALTDASSRPWRWSGVRSPLQVIGSYTRTCRCIIDPTNPEHHVRARAWWDAIAAAGQA